MAGVNRTSRELRLSLSLRMRVSESWVSVCVCWVPLRLLILLVFKPSVISASPEMKCARCDSSYSVSAPTRASSAVSPS